MQISSNAGLRLYVALDVDSEEKALEIVRECSPFGVGFKIGLQLFALGGPKLVSRIVAEDRPVFLDLKFHDIPNTVASAAVEATKLGVAMFNVHALGGLEMMQRTAEAVVIAADKMSVAKPSLIAVTVLTSSDKSTLCGIGVDSDVDEQVLRLAKLACEASLDGVVASAQEAAIIRAEISNSDFLIVTPGIRPVGATNDDQKRVTRPGSAIAAGASHLVVGRPITTAPDRSAALKQILSEIETALT
jgi:orotidine 5''-phosphate decarboxylase, subfamily 1